jgi:hypothetical protein
MKVVYSEEFKQVYSYDPASNPGRIESVEFALAGKVDYILPQPASEEDIGAVHTPRHIAGEARRRLRHCRARRGRAVKAAEIGLSSLLCRDPPPDITLPPTAPGDFATSTNGHRALPSQERDRIRKGLFSISTCPWRGNINIL